MIDNAGLAIICFTIIFVTLLIVTYLRGKNK